MSLFFAGSTLILRTTVFFSTFAGPKKMISGRSLMLLTFPSLAVVAAFSISPFLAATTSKRPTLALTLPPFTTLPMLSSVSSPTGASSSADPISSEL